MSNDVTGIKPGINGLAKFGTNKDNPFVNRGTSEVARAGGGGQFVSVKGKTGDIVSKDGIIPPGTTFAMDIWDAQSGWICWKNKKPVDKAMHFIRDNVSVDPAQLTDHGPYDGLDGWQQTIWVPMRDLEGGPLMLFTAANESSMRETWKLITSYGQQFGIKVDDAGNMMYPLVTIDVESFTSKFGKNWKPKFTINEWVSAAWLDALASKSHNDMDEDGGEPVQEELPPPPPKAAQKPAAVAPKPVGPGSYRARRENSA